MATNKKRLPDEYFTKLIGNRIFRYDEDYYYSRKYKTIDTKFRNEEKKMNILRLVKIVVLDLDKRVSLKDRILLDKEIGWTEDKDEDLWHSIGLNSVLAAHNEKRKLIVWEEKDCYGNIKTRTGLPPVKFSDLRKEVIQYASFSLK